MSSITSSDGSIIHYTQSGQGPSVIFVDGALQYSGFGQGMENLANLLEPNFTVIRYDRRGRGQSTDQATAASLQREIEDIAALIAQHGGHASLFGVSSGGALALEAALALGSQVNKLAIYEVPYNGEPQAHENWRIYRQKLDSLVAAGQDGEAVLHFMMFVGMPPEQAEGVKQAPFWPALEAIGASLAYDALAMGEIGDLPLDRVAALTVPTLFMSGDASFPFMLDTARSLADAAPTAELAILAGQSHEFDPTVLAPVLSDFLLA